MYCLKCGREVNEDKVFCPDCVAVMEQYPVKPGTVVLLPKRREGGTVNRTTARRKNLSPEEVIRKLRRKSVALLVAWLVTFLALCAMSVPGITHILEDNHFGLGQNYSVITPMATEGP